MNISLIYLKKLNPYYIKRLRAQIIAAVITFGCMVAALLLMAICALGEINYPDNLWKGILGEAVGEGYRGMYAVACVYRNRIHQGMPLGCVALGRKDLDKFVGKCLPFHHLIAKKVVRDVFENNAKDITGGATHYDNVEAFGMPSWAKNMQVTCRIGRHTFWKERG